MTELQTEVDLWGTRKTQLINYQKICDQLNLSTDKFIKLLSEQIGAPCYLTIHDEKLLMPGRWIDMKIRKHSDGVFSIK
jgi:hypothetical protein